MKLPTTTQDHAVGLQSVVQAIDNNAALLSAFDTRHSIGVGGNSPYGFPLRAVGRHDDILIARSVAEFFVDTVPATPTITGRLAGPAFGTLRVDRMAVGQWKVYLATPQLYAAVAMLKSTASVDRKANCYVAGSTSAGPTVIVSTWNVATPALADLSFSLVVWTQLP